MARRLRHIIVRCSAAPKCFISTGSTSTSSRDMCSLMAASAAVALSTSSPTNSAASFAPRLHGAHLQYLGEQCESPERHPKICSSFI